MLTVKAIWELFGPFSFSYSVRSCMEYDICINSVYLLFIYILVLFVYTSQIETTASTYESIRLRMRARRKVRVHL